VLRIEGLVTWRDETKSVVLFYGTLGDDSSTYREELVPLYDRPYLTISESTYVLHSRRLPAPTCRRRDPCSSPRAEEGDSSRSTDYTSRSKPIVRRPYSPPRAHSTPARVMDRVIAMRPPW